MTIDLIGIADGYAAQAEALNKNAQGSKNYLMHHYKGKKFYFKSSPCHVGIVEDFYFEASGVVIVMGFFVIDGRVFKKRRRLGFLKNVIKIGD